MKSWYKCETKQASKPDDGDICDVTIYDEIGLLGITAKNFIAAIKASSAKTINMRINSPGGSVFEGLAIYNSLRSMRDKTIICQIDGVAASMASIVALAASKITMPANAYMMIHQPFSGFADGANADDMRKMADRLDQFALSIAEIYAARSGKSVEECMKLMDEETWMDGRMAKEMGFCDEVLEECDIAACADVSRYEKRPDALKAKGLADVKTAPESMPPSPEVPPPATPATSEEQTKFVPPDMNALLNAQVGNEFYAAYRYFAIGAACQAKGLEGFAGRMQEQGSGEIKHAMKVYSYLVATGAGLELPPISAPAVDSTMDMLAITRAILDQEMSVTASWQEISKLAKEQDNAATQKLAQEFMAEQVEEENLALTLHQRVKLADTGSGILTIDADLKGAAQSVIDSIKAKARDEIIKEVTPSITEAINSEIAAKAKLDAEAKADPRAVAKKMIEIYGEDKGVRYFAKGFTVEQANAAFIDSIRAELGKVKADRDELATKLQVMLKSPAVPFEATAKPITGEEMKRAEFDAYCKRRGIPEDQKERLWESHCQLDKKAKQQKEGNDE